MDTMRDTSPEAVAKWIRRRAFWRKAADRLIVCASPVRAAPTTNPHARSFHLASHA